MTQDAKVQIGNSADFLEGVSVDTPSGDNLFREGVVISDPEIAGARVEVRQIQTALTGTDWGLVTHSVIQGHSTAHGGEYIDVKVNPSGALVTDSSGSVVALDSATLAALETVNVVQSGAWSVEVSNDVGNPLPVSGAVAVSNFPAIQAVSGTVALDAPTLAALESINVQNNVQITDSKQSGAWGYKAGVSGTPTIPANAKILQISATSVTGGSMTINGGDTVTLPPNGSISIEPRGNLVTPALVFTNTSGYFVEYVT